MPVAGITVLAYAVVTSGSVNARRVLVARVMSRNALVQLRAIELVDSVITRKTLARIRADHVDASGVGVAVMTLRSTLLLTLVHVYVEGLRNDEHKSTNIVPHRSFRSQCCSLFFFFERF